MGGMSVYETCEQSKSKPILPPAHLLLDVRGVVAWAEAWPARRKRAAENAAAALAMRMIGLWYDSKEILGCWGVWVDGKDGIKVRGGGA